jgi:hypothetical protein
MSDTTGGIFIGAAQALMTRRTFVGNTIAGGAALAAMPIIPVSEVFGATAAAAPNSGTPILTFDSYFTGWPVYDFGGTAEPYQPSAGRQPGAVLAAMSDDEFYRHHMYL